MIGSNLGERMCGVALMPAFEGEADTHGWSGGGPGRSGAEGRRSAEDRPERRESSAQPTCIRNWSAVALMAHELLQLRHLRQIWVPRNRMSHPYPPRIHFTAPINAFSASSDGQQQRSAPLFGSGAWLSMSISTGQSVNGTPMNRSVLTLLLTMIDG